MHKKVSAVFFSVIIMFSIFAVGFVSAQETAIIDSSEIISEEILFDPAVAGTTPDSFWYFLDFAHAPEEALAEAGLMAREGKVEEAQIALENFANAVESQRTDVESVNVEGVTLESLQSSLEMQPVYETQADLLNYQLYVDEIHSVLSEQAEAGVVEEAAIKEAVSVAENSIASVGVVVEEKTVGAIAEVVKNSEVPTIEADFAIEDSFSSVAEQRYPLTSPRFQEIADIRDIQEIKEKIIELRSEIAAREEAGETENLEEVRQLLDMAESHGVYCLHATEQELGITADIHLDAAEDFLDNAEDLFEGEIDVEDIKEELEVSEFLTTEEIQAEIQEEQEDAALFTENYEELREEYSDDPVKLTVLEAEKERLKKVEQLGTNLYESGIMDAWRKELEGEGLDEEDINAELHERWKKEWKLIYGEEYIPPGLYELPFEIQTDGSEGIYIGRVDLVERIDPVTGRVTMEIAEYYNKPVENVIEEGGGFAIGIPYQDPLEGYTYVYGPIGYTVTTPGGISYNIDYPKEYFPSNEYSYGDESFEYLTPEGNLVTYSALGYKFSSIDEKTGEEEVLVDNSYVTERVTFADGSTLNNDPTGYAFSDNEGITTVYTYNPEMKSYNGVSDGKIYIPQTPSSHGDYTTYNPVENIYVYPYAGDSWVTSGDGSWISSSGQEIRWPVVPAPIGYEDEGSWATPSGKNWVYDKVENKWTELVSGGYYYPSPNNYYRPDINTGYMIDTTGEALAPVGTRVTIQFGDAIETYVVDPEKGWIEEWSGKPVTPPYDPNTGKQYPNSVVGSGESDFFDDGYYSQIYGEDTSYSYTGSWSYDYATKRWRGGTGEVYDPNTGSITYADGRVYDPRDSDISPEEIGSCYACYYSTSETGEYKPSVRTYDYGGHYYKDPSGNYGYFTSTGEYQGAREVTSFDGISWTFNSATGEYVGTKPDGTTITGSEYASQQAGGIYSGSTPYSSYPGGYYGVYDPAGPNYDAAAAAAATAGGYYAGSGYGYSGGYGGYYDYSGSWVSTTPGTGYYPGTSGYSAEAAAAGWPGGAYPGGVAPYSGPYTGPVETPYSSGTGYYDASGNYVPSGSTTPGGYYGGTYDPATGTYSGGYTVGAGTYDAATGIYTYGSNTYSGGTYDPSTGSYTVGGGGTYDSSTGTYTSPSGTYDSSTSPGGESAPTGDGGGATSSGGDSGDGGGGGDSGGGGGESAPTGGVISDENSSSGESWFKRVWKKLFGKR